MRLQPISLVCDREGILHMSDGSEILHSLIFLFLNRKEQTYQKKNVYKISNYINMYAHLSSSRIELKMKVCADSLRVNHEDVNSGKDNNFLNRSVYH